MSGDRDEAWEALLAKTKRYSDASFEHDRTMRGDGIGFAVAATLASTGPGVTSGERASERLGGASSLERNPTMGSLPIVRLDGGITDASPASADLSNDFRPVKVIGEGGMGEVLLAHQTTLARDVAVKRLRQDAADPHASSSLFAEARIMGALEHPNIVPVHLLARDGDGNPVLVMKRIEGVSWRDLLRTPDHPFWDRLQLASKERLINNLEILMQVCSAAHFAHSRGIVHRDIKPENVMLGEFGEIYLVDWGIATEIGVHPASRSLVGTPSFMAPEMVHDPTHAVAATDVWLLGATLYYICTGRYRHDGRTLESVLRSVYLVEPCVYGDNVPEELVTICERAMAHRAEDRYPSAAALRQALAEFLRHRSSIQITEDGRRRLVECRQLHDDRPALPDADYSRRLQRLLTEARFAFEQALREWPDNKTASAAREETLALALDGELANGNLSGAETLLGELARPSDVQRRRVAALAREKRELQDGKRELQALRRDMDPVVGLSTRTGVLLVLIALTAVLNFIIRRFFGNGRDLTYPLMFTISGLIVTCAVSVHFVLSRRAERTRFNHNAGITIVASVVTGLGFRLLGWRFGIEPSVAMIYEQALYALVFSLSGLMLHSSLAWGALPQVAGLAVAVTWPAAAFDAFTTGSMMSFVTLVVVWQLQLRHKGAPGAPEEGSSS